MKTYDMTNVLSIDFQAPWASKKDNPDQEAERDGMALFNEYVRVNGMSQATLEGIDELLSGFVTGSLLAVRMAEKFNLKEDQIRRLGEIKFRLYKK